MRAVAVILAVMVFLAVPALGAEPRSGNVVSRDIRLFSFIATEVASESKTSRHVRICFPRGAEYDLIEDSDRKGFFDFRCCPSGLHAREAGCFKLSHVPSTLQTVDAKEPITLEFAGERLQVFAKDMSSKTVSLWISEIWAKGDPDLRYALMDSIWAARRVPIGLGEEAEVLLLFFPLVDLEKLRPSHFELRAAGGTLCGK